MNVIDLNRHLSLGQPGTAGSDGRHDRIAAHELLVGLEELGLLRSLGGQGLHVVAVEGFGVGDGGLPQRLPGIGIRLGGGSLRTCTPGERGCERRNHRNAAQPLSKSTERRGLAATTERQPTTPIKARRRHHTCPQAGHLRFTTGCQHRRPVPAAATPRRILTSVVQPRQSAVPSRREWPEFPGKDLCRGGPQRQPK